MATTTKKGSKSNARLRRSVKASQTDEAQTITKLREELAESLQRENATAEELKDCQHQLTEALEQQTATSEISLKELMMSTLAMADATVKLLVAKGIIIDEEFKIQLGEERANYVGVLKRFRKLSYACFGTLRCH
jgi:hypothetical protein